MPEGRAANQPFFAITLMPPMGLPSPGAVGQNLLDFFAGDFGDADIGWRQFLEGGLLLARGGSVDALVNWIAQFARECTVDFAGISFRGAR